MPYSGDADGGKIGAALYADYAAVGRELNAGAGVWFWRVSYTAQALGVERAIRKHRNEWRGELGLSPMAFPPFVLPKLKTAGARMQTVDGQPWQWRGSSDFCLYAKWLAGVDLSAVLNQRAAAGCTIVRVLGMMKNIMRFFPQEHAEFYDRLPAFAAWLEAAGLYLEFSVFADAQDIMPEVGQQQEHFARVCAMFQNSRNVLIEVGNEYGDWRSNDYGKNGFNPANFSKPAGLLSCRGSAVGDVPPIPAPWDYSTCHETRSFPGWVKDGNTIEIQNGYGDYTGLGYQHNIVHDEPQKMGTGFVTDRSLIAQFWGIVGASCTGGTFHCKQGITSDVWDGETQNCAETSFRAMAGAA